MEWTLKGWLHDKVADTRYWRKYEPTSFMFKVMNFLEHALM